MPTKDQSQTVDEIRQLMKKINQAWLQGRPQELKAYFHPDISICWAKPCNPWSWARDMHRQLSGFP